MDELIKDNFTGKYESEPNANKNLQFLTAKTIIGDLVKNDQNEHLGKIHDIMLDIRTGKIEYYVIEFGGFLGFNEKLFAIPFNLLKIDADEKIFKMQVEKSVLEKAPGFDKKHWPETNAHKQELVELSWGFWDNRGDEEF